MDEKKGIGTLGEKTLHHTLKNYFEPNKEKQEVRIKKYYADIYNEKGIIEIQTQQFYRLRGKLKVFLKEYPVTLVYPIPGKKCLYWLDQESGEISKGRVSPKKGTYYEICKELYRIKEYLGDPNLHLYVLILEIEEYRYLNGWSKDKKKGSSCCDKIPKKIIEELCIDSRADYKKLLPKGLPAEFGSYEFAKTAHISRRLAQITLNILFEVNCVERVQKKGNAWVYQIKG